MDVAGEPLTPDSLTYSVTLPAAPGSAAVARATVRTVLAAHGLADMADAVLQVVGELAACACRFTPHTEMYVSLRYREEALRVIVHDGHPRHLHPKLAAACESRRRAALRLLAVVVRSCGGEWGFGDAREPGGGTRMWAVLPRGGAAAFGEVGK
ncbi:ATP-binding protein [Streptomyces sp. NA04227]|nr:ATP-binding protein [Streptomyces sp. NA04227]